MLDGGKRRPTLSQRGFTTLRSDKRHERMREFVRPRVFILRPSATARAVRGRTYGV